MIARYLQKNVYFCPTTVLENIHVYMISIFYPTPKDNVYPSESLDTTDGNGAHVLTHVNSTGMYPMQMHTLDPPQSVLTRDIRIGTYERRLEVFPVSQLRPNRTGPTRQVELRVNVS